MNFRERVKAIVEATGKAYRTTQDRGGSGMNKSGDTVKVSGNVDPEEMKKRKARGTMVSPGLLKAALEKLRSGKKPDGAKKPAKKSEEESNPEEKSQTESSNHPFYQKVKELARGNKKNKSLLERKSKSVKTFKVLLGTVDKKSKPLGEARKKRYWEKSFGVDMTSSQDIADAIAKEKAEWEASEEANRGKKKPDADDDTPSRPKDPTDPGHASQHGRGVPKRKPPAKKKKKLRRDQYPGNYRERRNAARRADDKEDT